MLVLTRLVSTRFFIRSCHSLPKNNATELVTTPIFYVNASPHIGHAYSALLCDAYTRWRRMCGASILFSTGTDEHGAKVFRSAEQNGYEDPKEFCDKISKQFQDMLQDLNIKFDVFVRTTDPWHQRTVQALWTRLLKANLIYKGEHEGWYCQSDEAFLTEKQTKIVSENGKEMRISNESGHPVEFVKETNFIFRLAGYKEKIKAWMNTEPSPIIPFSRRIEAQVWVEDISDLSISRPRKRVKWGIPVPNVDDQLVYVWLDALTNYLTVSGIDVSKLENPKITLDWPRATHVIGKDILRFHSVYWPAFLFGANLKAPFRIIAHSHWTVDGKKMSKSLGNVVNPCDLVEKNGSDPLRYFLLRCGGLIDDGNFSHEALIARHNEELVNTLGNLLVRATSSKILKNILIPLDRRLLTDAEDVKLIEDLEKLNAGVERHYLNFEFPKAIDLIMNTLRATNAYFTLNKPWELAKNKASQSCNEDLNKVLYLTLSSVRICSILLQPIIPDTTAEILSILGTSLDERQAEHARVDHSLMLNPVKGTSFVVRKI